MNEYGLCIDASDEKETIMLMGGGNVIFGPSILSINNDPRPFAAIKFSQTTTAQTIGSKVANNVAGHDNTIYSFTIATPDIATIDSLIEMLNHLKLNLEKK